MKREVLLEVTGKRPWHGGPSEVDHVTRRKEGNVPNTSDNIIKKFQAEAEFFFFFCHMASSCCLNKM